VTNTMYAHRVIEDLTRQRNAISLINKPSEDQKRYMGGLTANINLIKKAQKIHIEDARGMVETKKSSFGKDLLFLDDAKYIKYPYELTYIDYAVNDQGPLDTRVDKVACLIIQQNNHSMVVQFMAQRIIGKEWFMAPVYYVISIGKRYENHLGNIQSIGWVGLDNQQYQKMVEEDREDLTIIHILPLLLNCKNIEMAKIRASKPLNKKRRKNHKQELFDYHVLNIVVPSNKKREYQEKAISLSNIRVHLCRGHFKEYTAEHPLFGKHTGLWWWQPSVRGKNKDGIVMKDYAVWNN